MRPVATLALAYMLVTLPAAAEVTTVNISHHPGLAVHVVADAERILRQDDFGLDVGTEAGWPVERHGYRHRASADSRLARAASIQSAVRRKIGCRR